MGRSKNCYSIKGTIVIVYVYRSVYFNIYIFQRKLRTVQKLCDQGQTQSIEEKPQTVSEPEQIPCKDNNKKQLKESDETTNTLQATEKNAQEKCKQNISKDTFAVSKKNSLSVETFEDNFDEEPLKQSNAMTDSIISTNSDISKVEKPSLSKEELQLMQLQLEHTEYLQLKSILQAKINSQKFDIVKLRSHMAIKSKQDSNLQKESDGLHSYTDLENEERYRLFKENALLEKKRLSLVGQIFQERIACIQLRIQLAMNEIM